MREFEKDPVDQAKLLRPQLVAAALTIFCAYESAGSPSGMAPLGSFKDWSRRVRDAMIWLGAADPVASLEEVRSLDPKLEAMSVVIAQVDEVLCGKTFTVPELVKLATESSTAPGLFKIVAPQFKRPELREALLTVAGGNNKISGLLLGRWLAAQKGRIVNGLSIEHVGTRQGYAVWEITGPPAP
jgi:hypothetical protein